MHHHHHHIQRLDDRALYALTVAVGVTLASLVMASAVFVWPLAVQTALVALLIGVTASMPRAVAFLRRRR